jgi:hypothetical protein
MESNHFFKKLSEAHPFITVCTYAQQDYVGIVQNRNETVTTLYDYGSVVFPELREKFLLLGDIWWWESNRSIPINIFLKDEWREFKTYIRTFNNKSLEIIHGPTVSMTDFNQKRSKRKSITLVKRIL